MALPKKHFTGATQSSPREGDAAPARVDEVVARFMNAMDDGIKARAAATPPKAPKSVRDLKLV